MKTLRNIKVPTGNILITEGERGRLEMLSLGDYGKDVNLKCDAMGLGRDIKKVEHTDLLPLTEKWVITISTQYGCSMSCNFCDVPMVGPGLSASRRDLTDQVYTGLALHPEVEKTQRLNIHFARMGEPTWNPNVLMATFDLCGALSHRIHPVVSTMMPKRNRWLLPFLMSWMDIKNNLLTGNAGLQLSINSTSDRERDIMFGGHELWLHEIAEIMNRVPSPRGRKITLNFAVAGYEIDPDKLLRFFPPEVFIIKLTPTHKTITATEHGIETAGDYTTSYPYEEIEHDLKKAGYDVLVFVASEYEDMGRITCGNAILSGSEPECPHEEVSQ
jgi:23S rRNA (adenine2503-C2)-methyltransferase